MEGERTSLALVCSKGAFKSLSPAAIHFAQSLCDAAPGNQGGMCRKNGRNSTRNFPGTRPCVEPTSASSDICT